MFSCLVLNKKNVPLQDKKRVFIYNGIKDSDNRKEANNPQKKKIIILKSQLYEEISAKCFVI